MKIDLHCHTHASFDCRMKPDRVLQRARGAGLDGIAITDHDTIEGALEAERIARMRGDLLVVVGEEISTASGEILGLFLKEVIRESDALSALKAIHDQGGVAVLPHPFVKHISIEEEVARELDGCEGFNARHAKMAVVDGTMGEPEIVTFAHHYGLSLTASSDSHTYSEIGGARTVFPVSDPEGIKAAIRSGNTRLEGRRVPSWFRWRTTALGVLGRMVDPRPREEPE